MDRESLTDYWSATAQVVPVLALAFVIEARLITRRLSKKNAFKDRGKRARWAGAFVLVAFGLTSAETNALVGIAVMQGEPVDSYDTIAYYTSLWSIVVSLLLVVSLPLMDIAVRTTVDLIQRLIIHMPWSRWRKLNRVIRGQLRVLAGMRRDANDRRLYLASRMADVLLARDDQIPRLARSLRHAYAEMAESELDPELVSLFEADGSDHLWMYRIFRWFYQDEVAGKEEDQRLVAELEKQLLKLQAIGRADSPDLQRLIRANMAAAARMS